MTAPESEESSIIVDPSLGAVVAEIPARDTVRLSADEIKKKIAELDAENVDPFAVDVDEG